MQFLSEITTILCQGLNILVEGHICNHCCSKIRWELVDYYYFKIRYSPLKPAPENISSNPSVVAILKKNEQVIYYLIYLIDECAYKIKQRKGWVFKNYYKNSYWIPLKNCFLKLLSDLHNLPQIFTHEPLSERSVELKVTSWTRTYYNRILSLFDVIWSYKKDLEKLKSSVDVAQKNTESITLEKLPCSCKNYILKYEGAKIDSTMWS